MKIIFVIVFLLLYACGKKNGSSPEIISDSVCGLPSGLTGNWVNLNRDDILTVSRQCTYGATGCDSAGYFRPYTISEMGKKRVLLQVLTTDSGLACLPTGTYICNYVHDEASHSLIIDCGRGIAYYLRE